MVWLAYNDESSIDMEQCHPVGTEIVGRLQDIQRQIGFELSKYRTDVAVQLMEPKAMFCVPGMYDFKYCFEHLALDAKICNVLKQL